MRPAPSAAAVVLACSLAAVPHLCHAQTAAISLDTIAATFRFDRNNNFGWRFTPTSDIDALALGYFDATSLPGDTGLGLAQDHPVGIYRVSDQALIASTVVPAGVGPSLSGHFRWAPLAASVRLLAGITYEVEGFCFSAGPDPAAAATAWSFPASIQFANIPTPTSVNLAGATSCYITSAGHGGGPPPPSGLAYAPLATTSLLPTFVANLQFVPANACPADFDASGALAVADIFAFLNAWFAGSPTADFDGVSGLQVADIFAFLNAWFSGC